MDTDALPALPFFDLVKVLLWGSNSSQLLILEGVKVWHEGVDKIILPLHAFDDGGVWIVGGTWFQSAVGRVVVGCASKFPRPASVRTTGLAKAPPLRRTQPEPKTESAMNDPTRINIPAYLDHSFLDPVDGLGEFDRFCDDCIEYEVAAACVPVFWVKRAVARLGTNVPVSGVVAFPTGLEGTDAKVAAARQCVAEGARELDVVCAWTAIKCGDLDEAFRDARAVVEAAHAENSDVYIKLILEIPELTREEKLAACDIVVRSGAACLKTQTGRNRETTLDDLRLVREALPDRVHVKASVTETRNVSDAEILVALGAIRIGCDYPIDIVREWRGLQPALSAGISP